MNIFSDALKANGGQPLPLHLYTPDEVQEGSSQCSDTLVMVERRTIFDAVHHESQFTLLVTLLLGGVSPNVKRERDGATPLHVAIINNNERDIPIALGTKLNVVVDVPCSNASILRFLVDNGCDINAKAFGDETPLMVAAACHNLRALRLLLASGADYEARDRTGRNCFSYGAPYPNVLMTFKEAIGEEKFMWIVNRDDLLHQVCHRAGCKFAALFLVEQLGVDVNGAAHQSSDKAWHTVRDGFTPLHCAVTSGDLALTKALVSAGADIEKPDSFGVTAVQLACNATVSDVRSSRDDSFTADAPINPNGIRVFLLRYRSYSSPTRREALALADPAPTIFSPLNLSQFIFTATIPHFLMYFASLAITSFTLLLLVLLLLIFFFVRVKQADEKGIGKSPHISQRPLRCLGGLLGFIVMQGVCLPLYSTWIHYQAFCFAYEVRWPLLYWVLPSTGVVVLSLLFVMIRSPGYVQSSPGQRKSIYASVEKLLHETRIPKELLYSVDWPLMAKKPMRAQHCVQTNRLVLRHNGFSALTGSSIGANNHRAYIFFQFALLSAFSGCYYFALAYNRILSTSVAAAGDSDLRCELSSTQVMAVEKVRDILFSTAYFRFGYMYTQIALPLVLILLVLHLLGDLYNIMYNLTAFDVEHADTHSSLYCFRLKDSFYSLYDRGVLQNCVDFFLKENLAAISFRAPSLTSSLKKRVEDFQKSEMLLAAKPCCDDGECDHHAENYSAVPSANHYEETTENGRVTAVNVEMSAAQARATMLFQELVRTNGASSNFSCPTGVTSEDWERTKSQALQMYQFFKQQSSAEL